MKALTFRQKMDELQENIDEDEKLINRIRGMINYCIILYYKELNRREFVRLKK